VTDVTSRCILVDDSEEFLASATRLLESQGIEIVGRAMSGEAALELADRLSPDLALVDIELADEDGISLAQALHVRAPATRIVLISAYERDDLADLISDSSAVGFVPKRSLGADAIAAVLDSA
jgi:DNA-binding NarL/FixJ family response regulator